jgi:hypothetical protein
MELVDQLGFDPIDAGLVGTPLLGERLVQCRTGQALKVFWRGHT